MRAGIFRNPQPWSYAAEAYRTQWSAQRQTTACSPAYNSPLTPVAGSIQVSTVNQVSPHFNQVASLQAHLSIEHTLHNQIHFAGVLYWLSN